MLALVADASPTFHVTTTQVSLVLAVFIPALVAFFTKVTAPPAVKQGMLILLTAIGGWFATATTDTEYSLAKVLTAIGVTFAFSVASYLGLKAFTVTPIEKATGNFGIGPSTPR